MAKNTSEYAFNMIEDPDQQCEFEVQYWTDSSYHYEITTTVNPNIYNLTQASFEQAEHTFYDRLFYYIAFHKIKVDQLTVVREYQKNRFPHWHCLLSSPNEINPKIRQSVLGGFQQNVGKTSFKQVADLYKFEDYLQKDLKSNYEKHNLRHYKIFRQS